MLTKNSQPVVSVSFFIYFPLVVTRWLYRLKLFVHVWPILRSCRCVLVWLNWCRFTNYICNSAHLYLCCKKKKKKKVLVSFSVVFPVHADTNPQLSVSVSEVEKVHRCTSNFYLNKIWTYQTFPAPQFVSKQFQFIISWYNCY